MIRRLMKMCFMSVMVLCVVLLALVSGAVFLFIHMPGSSFFGPTPPLSKNLLELRDALRTHVTVLAGHIGERNMWTYPSLERAAEHIERVFRDLGYSVQFQDYPLDNRRPRNLEVEVRGSTAPNEIVIVGAHYDSVIGSPGANDNATGTAAVLELARLFRDRKPARTVRFAAFVNEEPPFFETRQMGSLHYARRSRERGEKIVAMYSIETVGYFSDARGSQRYPFPFNLVYPDTGDFIAFVGNVRSRSLVRRSIAAFRKHCQFPSEGVASPGWIPGIGWSDHRSFWMHGYSAVMVTDTALYRYPHYHSPEDTPDKVDYSRLAQVINGLADVIGEVASAD
jgi:hypothetical protein